MKRLFFVLLFIFSVCLVFGVDIDEAKQLLLSVIKQPYEKLNTFSIDCNVYLPVADEYLFEDNITQYQIDCAIASTGSASFEEARVKTIAFVVGAGFMYVEMPMLFVRDVSDNTIIIRADSIFNGNKLHYLFYLSEVESTYIIYHIEMFDYKED